jgi:hypothetical protein
MPVTKKLRRKAPVSAGRGASEKEIDPVKWIDYLRPKASVRSRIRSVGNSKGIILGSPVIEMSGLNADADIVIQAVDGMIFIFQFKEPGVNTDLSTWDKQFKNASKKGGKADEHPFEEIVNDFDLKEW